MTYWNSNDNGNDDRTQTLLRQNEIKKKNQKSNSSKLQILNDI